jgi:FtsP/CotA-like multicopper oxidase with cupredoxin domain
MPLLARMWSRRRFLAGTGVAFGSLGLPAILRAEVASDGFRVLRAAQGATRGEGQPSSWGYGGTAPGPTLRLKRGEELRIRLVNELHEPTTIHWHGVRLPNAMDGVPHLTQPPVAPGTSFDYVFRPPDAGSFWYHAHAPGQVDRGLHGALIVDEAQPVKVDADVVLVLGMPGELGGAAPFVLVNGSVRPEIPVKAGERVRLRLINSTSARRFSLRIERHSPWVMAIDGQPAEPFVARDGRVALAPGSRVDLFVDAMQSPGTAAAILAGWREEQPVARLVYQGGADPRATPRSEPSPLPPNPLPARIDLKGSLKAELTLGDARPLDPAGPPLFTVRRGRAVTLGLRNPTGHPQVMHVHGHHVRLLDRLDDGWKPYWLDTLVVGEQVERIAFVADNPGKWLIRCRRLEAAASDTAVWFAVS